MKNSIGKELPLLVLLLLLNSSIIFASPLEELNTDRLAISLVIDTSGSMLNTDPDLLRSQVADIFIDLLGPDDYLGIVTFNSQVDLVVPMTKLESQTVRDGIKAQLTGRLQGTGDTDYTSALGAANRQLEELYVANVRKQIIFLTDGRPDPDPINITANPVRMNEYMTGLWNQVALIGENEFPVYSIGFSDGIDVEILNRLAADTGGDVKIYRDSAELDANLIQVLKSRELLVKELLAPAIIQSSNLKPVLNNEFWPRAGGYRVGEFETAVASVMIGNQPVASGLYLKVEKVELIIEKEGGLIEAVELFDNGLPANDDVRAGDGRWSNRINFTEEYKGKVTLSAKLEYKGEAYDLTRELGEIMVAKPGSVAITQKSNNVWVKSGDTAVFPITIENQSPFKEVITVALSDGEGSLTSNQIETASVATVDANIILNLPEGIDKGIYDYSFSLGTLYPETEIKNASASYKLEVVGFFGGLAKMVQENLLTIAILASIFLVLPLLIYMFGLLLYGILIKPSSRLRGTLKIWREDEPDNKKELRLKKLKRELVVLSFDKSSNAVEYLESERFKYDIVITRKMLIEGKKFLLGWKRLFSKKAIAYTVASCTMPGIIEHKGNISSEIKLYDGDEFSSGGYRFLYEADKKGKRKEDEAGRDILEGRTNGI